MDENEYKKWLSQFRKGYIELCTLLALKKVKSMHGLALLKYFENNSLKINEGTLYPLLNRMEQNDWLISSWNIPQTSGHPKENTKFLKKVKKFYLFY